MELVFRRARQEDLPAIVAMLADDGLGAGREDASLPLDPRYLAAFRAIDTDPNQMLVLAETPEGEPVGTMQLGFLPGLSMKGTWRAQVEAVRIASPHRGRGLGRRMMEWAMDQARARGCGLMQLTTHVSRDDAHRFYQGLGFAVTHKGMKRKL